jgi:hypothetical protein
MVVGKDINQTRLPRVSNAGKDTSEGWFGGQVVKKDDLVHIVILLAVALGIGIYLIATTVLIAKDGVLYIEQAQNFSNDPIGIIKGDRPFGYPFLIFTANKLVSFGFDKPLRDKLTTRLGCGTSVSTWIYCAQSVALLCRLLALVPLYFIGKFLVGSKRSFWAILILVILPYPARFGSDVLRDWPHILFLATGFLFLLLGAEHGKYWMFGVAGLAAGLGHIIRAECAQIVIYGILWLLISLFLTKPNISRLKAVCLMLVLLIGFAIPAAPYFKIRGEVLPPKLRELISCDIPWQSNELEQNSFSPNSGVYTASAIPIDILNALVRLAQEISDNLMYFFVPALVIGIYARFCRQSEATSVEKFFIPAFIVLNVIMLILLYCNCGYISRRHASPLIVFTIFYVAIGMQELAIWLSSVSSRIKPACPEYPTQEKTPPRDGTAGRSNTNQSRQLFFVLLVIGGIICLPKLFSPIRNDKNVYIMAADWLKQNTAQKDLIAVPDIRISFYAERKGLGYEDDNPSEQVDYVVKIVKGEQEEPALDQKLHEVKWFYLNERSKKQKLIIYKTM